LAKNVLVYRTVTESTEQGRGSRVAMGVGATSVGGWAQWSIPFGAYSGANRAALHAARYFAEFGTTREQLGMIAVTQRRNAAHNEDAVYRQPLTLNDYLEARMISSPLCLYDCDVPVDGSVALVVSHAQAAANMRRPPIAVEAFGSALRARPSWDQWAALSDVAAYGAAESMWSRSSLRPADVDAAQLYDGFSMAVLVWLEALGFCSTGEGGAFVEGGERIGLSGQLPINTGGGQLSAGRLSGFGHLYEAILQLRGEGNGRQLPKTPEVAVVTNGAGPIAGCVLLTVHR
jgi:acetyl-CoA acetyltransferase